MSKLESIVFGFGTISLIIATITHPYVGTMGAIWMVLPVMLFVPYGIIKVLEEKGHYL